MPDTRIENVKHEGRKKVHNRNIYRQDCQHIQKNDDNKLVYNDEYLKKEDLIKNDKKFYILRMDLHY